MENALILSNGDLQDNINRKELNIMTEINKTTPMEELTIGGNIYTSGNSKEFKTGDWRSIRPVYIEEKCKQCGLCFPVCPENAIPVNK